MSKVRVHQTSRLLVFLVDLSWSMAVAQRLTAAKGAIIELLTQAYQQRDRVCLITFQKDSAHLVIPPTRSVMLAERAMKQIMIGGKTPLAAGLRMASDVMTQEQRKDKSGDMLLIVLSDGDGNVSINGGDPREESRLAAEEIAAKGFKSIVINSEQITFDEGHANRLAKQLNAPCHLIANIRPDSLLKLVKPHKP